MWDPLICYHHRVENGNRVWGFSNCSILTIMNATTCAISTCVSRPLGRCWLRGKTIWSVVRSWLKAHRRWQGWVIRIRFAAYDPRVRWHWHYETMKSFRSTDVIRSIDHALGMDCDSSCRRVGMNPHNAWILFVVYWSHKSSKCTSWGGRQIVANPVTFARTLASTRED